MRFALLLLLLLPQERLQNKSAFNAKGMVACEHKDGVAAGVEILEKGGNAVDAAVASAFAMGVALPSHSGLGGRSQLLVRLKAGRAYHVDGGTQVAKGANDLPAGALASVCIPGSLAALALALKEGGSLSLKDAMAPAIRLARDKEQADLVATLETIAANGPEAFYGGSIADAIDADMKARGGSVRKADLVEYKAVLREVIRGAYRGHEVIACDRPASGATVLEALHVLATFDFSKVESDVDREHLLIEALRLAFEDRGGQRAPDDAKKRAAEIDLKKAGVPKVERDPDGDTTHISVVDKDGNACAFTQSLGPWFGAGKAKGLGFYYNATQGVAGTVAPGERHRTGQCPTIFVRDGRPSLVLGSAGETRIISAVVATAHRVLDRGRSLRDAVFSPRWHWDGSQLVMEQRLDAKELELSGDLRRDLRARGFEFVAQPSSTWFGRLQAIQWDAKREGWLGVADVRGHGTASGPK